jgi:hypothetical protein
MDPSGLVTPATANGEPLFFLFKDVKTEFNHVVTGLDQSERTVRV